MEHLEGYLNSSTGKDAAATMIPNQTMLVAAVKLGISDARGISSALLYCCGKRIIHCFCKINPVSSGSWTLSSQPEAAFHLHCLQKSPFFRDQVPIGTF